MPVRAEEALLEDELALAKLAQEQEHAYVFDIQKQAQEEVDLSRDQLNNAGWRYDRLHDELLKATERSRVETLRYEEIVFPMSRRLQESEESWNKASQEAADAFQSQLVALRDQVTNRDNTIEKLQCNHLAALKDFAESKELRSDFRNDIVLQLEEQQQTLVESDAFLAKE